MELKELLSPDRVAVGVVAADWQEAVQAAGQLLVDTGGAEERYIEGMIKTTKELGPYIVIAPGLAIPHSRPEDGVIQACMAVVSLSTPVSFGNEENDPVKVLIAFGAKDHEEHIQALGQMTEILSVPENLEALKAAGTAQEVLGIMLGSPET
jgi:mannitol/fructose-specific phosphotransferase system IIA component (Ntr-type)